MCIIILLPAVQVDVTNNTNAELNLLDYSGNFAPAPRTVSSGGHATPAVCTIHVATTKL